MARKTKKSVRRRLARALCVLLCLAIVTAAGLRTALRKLGDCSAYPLAPEFAAALQTARPTVPENTGGLRLMNYNVLSDGKGFTGTDARSRYRALEAVLAFYHPDVVTLQEMSLRWYACLTQNSETYELVRPFDTGIHLRTNGILYTPAKLRLLESGAAPYVEHDDARLRCMVWAEFEEKAGGARFWVVTTHFNLIHAESEAADAAVVSAQTTELLSRIESFGDAPVLVAGDFNAHEDPNNSRAYFAYERLAARLQDVRFHAQTLFFGAERTIYYSSSDHIFTGGEIRPVTFALLSHRFLLGLSDHYPIFTDFVVGNAPKGN